MKKKVSIIIPTRERVDTLIHTVKTALDQESKNFEVIIGDNYSNDNTALEVAKINDDRLVYINSGKRLSMSDNWEFCLEHAQGEYIIFIGDDDAIVPGSIDRFIKQLKELNFNYDAYSWVTSTYVWPIDGKNAYLDFSATRQENKEIDLKRLAIFVQKYGGWRYYRIPGAYHAAVKKEVFNEIRRITGRVFHTTQPDLFTSICVGALVEKSYRLGSPLSIQGRSAKSNGGSGISIDGAKHLKRYQDEFGVYQIHPTLCPDIAKYGMLIIDGIIRAMDYFPEIYPRGNFNYDAMWAYLIRAKVTNLREIIENNKNINAYKNINYFKLSYYLIIHYILEKRRLLIKYIVKNDLNTGIPPNIFLYAKKVEEEYK